MILLPIAVFGLFVWVLARVADASDTANSEWEQIKQRNERWEKNKEEELAKQLREESLAMAERQSRLPTTISGNCPKCNSCDKQLKYRPGNSIGYGHYFCNYEYVEVSCGSCGYKLGEQQTADYKTDNL